MINRKGLSPIVATILIIMLTVGAVAMLAKFIVPFVKDNLNKGSECVNYRDYFKFVESFEFEGKELAFNCREGGLYGAMIQSSAEPDLGKEVAGFKIIFTGEADSANIVVKDEQKTSKKLNEGRMLNKSITKIEIPKEGEINTFVFNLSKDYENMEIYPILNSGRVCEDKTDIIKIKDCETSLVVI